MAIVRRQNTRSLPVRGWLADYDNPFGEVERFFNEMASPLLTQGGFNGYPADLYETDEHIVLEMAVPGVRAEDLDISLEGRQLSVQGKLPQFAEGEERRYWLQGIPRGEFSRTVSLPATVVIDDVQARVNDGLLTLHMPKVAEAKTRKIEIKNG